MKHIIIILFLLLGTFSNLLAQNRQERKRAKEEKRIEEYMNSVHLADDAQFIFKASFAHPQSGGRFVLYSIEYTLKVSGDSIEVFLPYYGVSRLAPVLGSIDRGIKYKGVISDYKVERHDKKKEVLIKFSSKGKDQESYQYRMYLGTRDDARLTIISTHRDVISYTGERFLISQGN